MGSLLFNFIKRAVLVPAVITGILAAALIAYAPTLNASLNEADSASEGGSPDLSVYSSKQYSAFDELESEDLIGTIKCSEIGLSETPVVYASSNKSDVSLLSGSTEPWNEGSLVVFGENRANQFSALHNAKKGDVVTFSFYANNSYEYEIESIVTGLSYKQLDDYAAENTLVMVLPYNDFSDIGNSYLYTVYSAKQI